MLCIVCYQYRLCTQMPLYCYQRTIHIQSYSVDQSVVGVRRSPTDSALSAPVSTMNRGWRIATM